MALSRVSKAVVVLGLLVGCLALVVATRPVWLSASIPGSSGVPVRLSARGSELAALVPTAAIVVAASAAALTLARGATRYLVLGLAALASLGCLISATLVALRPASAVRGLLAEKAGVTTDSLTTGVSVATTVWPVVTATVALLVLAWTITGMVAARQWGNRNDVDTNSPGAAAGSPSEDPAAAWDALSHGDDPTR